MGERFLLSGLFWPLSFFNLSFSNQILFGGNGFFAGKYEQFVIFSSFYAFFGHFSSCKVVLFPLFLILEEEELLLGGKRIVYRSPQFKRVDLSTSMPGHLSCLDSSLVVE